MSFIVTPKPPALHAPCMRALAPSYDSIVVGCWVGHPAAQAIAVQVCRIHMEPLMQPYAYVKNEVHNFEFHGLCIRLLSRALVAV